MIHVEEKPVITQTENSIGGPTIDLLDRTDVTIDELEADPPGYVFDLIDGKVVPKMPSIREGDIVAKIAEALFIYLKANPIGRIMFNVNYRIIPESRRESRAPDISFIKHGRFDPPQSGYPAIAPDLAIEVVSENDRVDAVFDKARLYINCGVQEVWVVIPISQEVLVYTATTISGTRDVLTSTVLPGLALDVKAIFSV